VRGKTQLTPLDFSLAVAGVGAVLPVGQKAEYVIRAIETVMPYLPRPAVASAA
jgi:hypothetical protein